MNTKMLMPILITVHLTVAAIVVGGLGVEEPDAGHPNLAWQVNAPCLAGHVKGGFPRYGSSEYRQLNAMAADPRTCVNVH